ncbi:isochorismatase family protein [Sanguibacter sp. 25GB23B1]|uniref:isochorismatase family protein n=1 Tax=unclassified Sanguibacter TaxID=2645534 RepID=UPI0032AEF558
MPVAELDAQIALVVVDLQVGTTANPTAHPVEGVITHAVHLVDAFRTRALPVVLATVTGTPAGRTAHGAGAREFPPAWSELRPELDQQPDDLVVTRRTWSAFAGTDLDAQLRERGITQIVLAGLATSFGVESTARQGYDLGYGVVLAADAMTDPRQESHDASVQRVFPALGQVATADEIVALLPPV